MIRINLDEAIKAGIFENSLPLRSADFTESAVLARTWSIVVRLRPCRLASSANSTLAGFR